MSQVGDPASFSAKRISHNHCIYIILPSFPHVFPKTFSRLHLKQSHCFTANCKISTNLRMRVFHNGITQDGVPEERGQKSDKTT